MSQTQKQDNEQLCRADLHLGEAALALARNVDYGIPYFRHVLLVPWFIISKMPE